MGKQGSQREPWLRVEWDSRVVAGSAQLARVDIVAQGSELWPGNTGTMSSALEFAF